VLDLLPLGGGFEVGFLKGCRVATVSQLLFAPWAWAYSALHPEMVGKSSTSLSGWGEGEVCSLVAGSR